MAEGKKTFIFYSDWINMVREMDNEDAGELLKHILSYVNDENPTTDNKFVKMAFGHMKPMLKSDLDKWDKQLKKFSDMGKASAESRKVKKKPTYVKPTLTQVEPTCTVNDNDNVNVIIDKSIINKTKEQLFLEDWNELRLTHLKKRSNIKTLSGDDKDKFKELIKSYTREEMQSGLVGLFKQKKLPNDNQVMQSNPKHFLQYFNSYLTAFLDKNTNLYGKQEDKQY